LFRGKHAARNKLLLFQDGLFVTILVDSTMAMALDFISPAAFFRYSKINLPATEEVFSLTRQIRPV